LEGAGGLALSKISDFFFSPSPPCAFVMLFFGILVLFFWWELFSPCDFHLALYGCFYLRE
jgi:hypothetical protein